MERRPGVAAAVGVAGIAGMLVVYAFAFHSGRAMNVDLDVLQGFRHLYRGRIADLAAAVPHISDPAPFLLWFVLIVGTAIARGRPRLALTAGVVLFGSSLATHLLKPEIDGVRYSGGAIAHLPYVAHSWPSGHATASMAVALCAILVAPARWRPAVSAIAAVYTLAVTFALLMAGWHFPSDVVAGYLMAGTWTAFGVAGLWASERRRPTGAQSPTPAVPLPTALAPAVVVAVAGLGLFLLVTFARPVEVTQYAADHTFFVIGAGVIAGLALTLVAVLTAAMTNTPREPGGDPAPTADRRPRSRPGRG